MRARLPVTPPTSSAPSGPASVNRTARGFPSSTAAMGDQVDRRVVHDRLAGLDEAIDEGAEAEPFQIGCGGDHGGQCY